jgi:hypothetical protein
MQVKAIAPLLLMCAASVLGQNNQCSQKLNQLPDAPELFGFRMGMTTDQVKKRIPHVVFGPVNEFGVLKTSINPDFDPRIDKTLFSGVRTISLDFLDGRLTSLWLGYDGSFKWRTVPEFVKGISQSLRLPDAWTSWKARGQQINCADFQMTVTFVAEGPSFHITDTIAEQTVAARREAKAELDSAAEEETSPEIVADQKAMVYYSDGCIPEKEIKEGNRVVFKNTEEAEKAGYKPAKQCH